MGRKGRRRRGPALENAFECTICNNIFSVVDGKNAGKPALDYCGPTYRSLTCRHSYCLGCCESFADGGKKFPTCRQENAFEREPKPNKRGRAGSKK